METKRNSSENRTEKEKCNRCQGVARNRTEKENRSEGATKASSEREK